MQFNLHTLYASDIPSYQDELNHVITTLQNQLDDLSQERYDINEQHKRVCCQIRALYSRKETIHKQTNPERSVDLDTISSSITTIKKNPIAYEQVIKQVQKGALKSGLGMVDSTYIENMIDMMQETLPTTGRITADEYVAQIITEDAKKHGASDTDLSDILNTLHLSSSKSKK